MSTTFDLNKCKDCQQIIPRHAADQEYCPIHHHARETERAAKHDDDQRIRLEEQAEESNPKP